MDREAWRAVIHGVGGSQTRLSDWTELNWRFLANDKFKEGGSKGNHIETEMPIWGSIVDTSCKGIKWYLLTLTLCYMPKIALSTLWASSHTTDFYQLPMRQILLLWTLNKWTYLGSAKLNDQRLGSHNSEMAELIQTRATHLTWLCVYHCVPLTVLSSSLSSTTHFFYFFWSHYFTPK